MTQSYSQLRKKIDSLQQKADSARTKEAAGIVARIRQAISFYGLTAAELGLGNDSASKGSAVLGRSRVRAANRSKRKISSEAKFRDEAGNEWVGRGPRPLWLRTALASGKSLNDFTVGSPAKPGAAAKTAVKRMSKRKPVAKFTDGAGRTWSGRGRKPGWFTSALAQGKSPDSMRA